MINVIIVLKMLCVVGWLLLQLREEAIPFPFPSVLFLSPLPDTYDSLLIPSSGEKCKYATIDLFYHILFCVFSIGITI